MRVVFLGNTPWSVASLEALADSPHRPALVMTREPRPAGRGNRRTPTAVADAARRLDLPLREVATVKSGPGFDTLVEAVPEGLVVVAYGEILPRAVLHVPMVAPVNLHFSLLPELRGAAPVQRAILEGLVVTGVTTIRMNEGMDTGPILLQTEEATDEDDDAASLGGRLAAIGGRLLVDTLDRLEAGTLIERPQDDAAATYAPKLTAADELIRWPDPSVAVVRRIRALAPVPGARASFRGRALKLFAARAAPIPGGILRTDALDPGSILDARMQDVPGLLVQTGDGAVVLEEVQPEGRRRMAAADFVRGYHPLVGERLA
jgi:methionyl-tRNA formyltransferase